MNIPKSRWRILIADDSEDDRFFVKRTLSAIPEVEICAEVEDGNEAIHYISGQGKFADRDKYPYPNLLLLDLKMPKCTGYEVLQWIQEPPPKNLPVIVVSNSPLQLDQDKCSSLGAIGYCVKGNDPLQQEFFIKTVEASLNNLKT